MSRSQRPDPLGDPPPGRPRWFDSHCHVHDEADPDAILARARQAGVAGIVCAGTDVESSLAALALAKAAGAGVWATAGLHPHHADRPGEAGVAGVAGLLQSDGVEPVAVGECGLDYHYDNAPRGDQRRAFAAQVVLARQHGRTLVIHTREAWDDTFAILAEAGAPARLVFHCFTGGPEEARRCLDLGAWLSFSGIVTFKGAGPVREAAALCPAGRLLVETDSPYLAPVPHRGRRNEPGWVPLVGAAVAQARGETPEDLSDSSWAAAVAAFALEDDGGIRR